jgi:hypothetical protein
MDYEKHGLTLDGEVARGLAARRAEEKDDERLRRLDPCLPA